MGGQRRIFSKADISETSDMTSEGSREMLGGDSADTCGENFPLASIRAERRDSDAQTPIGVSGNFALLVRVGGMLCSPYVML